MRNILDDFIDGTRANLHIEQGSDEWNKLRCGRFTSSEWWKLMECGKREMTKEELAARPKTGKGSKTTQVPDPSKMSATGIKYIRKKVWETLTGQPFPEAYAYPLVYGKEQEPFAVEHFEKITGLKTEIVGFQVYTDHAGASPDRLVGELAGLEIKCPSSDEQIDYLMLTDHFDLKRCYPEYYWQCLSLMLFMDKQEWYFATFDPRMQKEDHKMSILSIKRALVQEDIDLIPLALAGAVEEKLKLINLL